jgi:pimeloyl-ACP methyl ester carboxylesterase
MTLRLRDIEVAYRAEGEGPRVVLIHGLGQDHRMWSAQQEALTGHRTLAYDLRGHGGTTAGAPAGTLAQLGGDLIALLEDIGPSTCVGFSLGGTVALWAASERPDLVPEVVAVATSSVVGRAAAAFFAERIELFSSGDDAAIRDAVLQDTRAQLSGPSVDADAIAAQRVEAIGDRQGYLNAARAMIGVHEQSLNDRLERIAQPVLVVSGEHDAFCPRRAADLMLEHLPDGRFHELPGVGHLVTDEDPDAVTRVLADRLGRGARA